ncbi:SMR family transporter [Variovorax saccharolyticus]
MTYAVWAGSGVALTAIVGIICFDELITPLRVLGLVLIVGGVISLHIGAR